MRGPGDGWLDAASMTKSSASTASATNPAILLGVAFSGNVIPSLLSVTRVRLR